MSMETYEELTGRLELYQSILTGMSQISNGETVSEKEMMEKLRNL